MGPGDSSINGSLEAVIICYNVINILVCRAIDGQAFDCVGANICSPLTHWLKMAQYLNVSSFEICSYATVYIGLASNNTYYIMPVRNMLNLSSNLVYYCLID